MSNYDNLERFYHNRKEFTVCLMSTKDDLHGKFHCDFCGKEHDSCCEVSSEIVEMYDENGVDISRKSMYFHAAKKRYRADGKNRVICYACEHGGDISNTFADMYENGFLDDDIPGLN